MHRSAAVHRLAILPVSNTGCILLYTGFQIYPCLPYFILKGVRKPPVESYLICASPFSAPLLTWRLWFLFPSEPSLKLLSLHWEACWQSYSWPLLSGRWCFSLVVRLPLRSCVHENTNALLLLAGLLEGGDLQMHLLLLEAFFLSGRIKTTTALILVHLIPVIQGLPWWCCQWGWCEQVRSLWAKWSVCKCVLHNGKIVFKLYTTMKTQISVSGLKGMWLY